MVSMPPPIDSLKFDLAGVWEAKVAYLADCMRLDEPIPEQAMASLRVELQLPPEPTFLDPI